MLLTQELNEFDVSEVTSVVPNFSERNKGKDKKFLQLHMPAVYLCALLSILTLNEIKISGNVLKCPK